MHKPLLRKTYFRTSIAVVSAHSLTSSLGVAGGAVGARAFGPGPPASNPGFQRWRSRVEDLATCPNVNVKLGGLAMIANGFELHRRAVPIGSEELAECAATSAER